MSKQFVLYYSVDENDPRLGHIQVIAGNEIAHLNDKFSKIMIPENVALLFLKNGENPSNWFIDISKKTGRAELMKKKFDHDQSDFACIERLRIVSPNGLTDGFVLLHDPERKSFYLMPDLNIIPNAFPEDTRIDFFITEYMNIHAPLASFKVIVKDLFPNEFNLVYSYETLSNDITILQRSMFDQFRYEVKV